MTGPDLDQFTAPLPDHLHCPVCLGAAYPPVVACSREHIVCRGCLVSMCQKNPRPLCPTCREHVPVVTKVSPGFKRAIESYSYKCELGQCEWIGSIGDHPQHVKDSCNYRVVKCPCSANVLAKNLAAHNVECPIAYISCPRGKTCSGVTLSTRSDGSFRRREMAAHDLVCTMFKCSLRCDTYTTAANLVAHRKACKASVLHLKSLERKLAIANELVRKYQDELDDKREGVQRGAQGRARDSGDDDDVVVKEEEEERPRKRKRVRHASAPEVLMLESSDGDELEVRVPGEAAARSTGGRRAAAKARGRRAASDGLEGAPGVVDSPEQSSKKWLLLD